MEIRRRKSELILARRNSKMIGTQGLPSLKYSLTDLRQAHNDREESESENSEGDFKELVMA